MSSCFCVSPKCRKLLRHNPLFRYWNLPHLYFGDWHQTGTSLIRMAYVSGEGRSCLAIPLRCRDCAMNLLDILKQTLATLRAHKMRSFLTMFGIIWGIASVILLVGLGLGFSKDQKKRMETLGKDLVIIWG